MGFSPFNRYRKGSDSVAELKEFPGHGHYSIIGGSRGWEDVADYAVDWATRMSNATADARAAAGAPNARRAYA